MKCNYRKYSHLLLPSCHKNILFLHIKRSLSSNQQQTNKKYYMILFVSFMVVHPYIHRKNIWCNNWYHFFFLIFSFTFSFTSHLFNFHINYLILFLYFCIYNSSVLFLCSLWSLNSMVVQCTSNKVLVHLQHAPSLTIQLS